MKKMLRLRAFTLAETLITLVIIGVVASLTLPVVKEHADEVQYVSLTQKVFAEINEVIGKIEYKHGDIRFIDFNSDATKNLFKDYMEASPIPEGAVNKWDTYKIDGSKSDYIMTPQFMTSNGIAWQMTGAGMGDGNIIVDLNGANTPNVIGVDIHGFKIGKSASNSDLYGVFAYGDKTNDTANQDFACTAYVLKYKKIPWMKGGYAKCEDVYGK